MSAPLGSHSELIIYLKNADNASAILDATSRQRSKSCQERHSLLQTRNHTHCAARSSVARVKFCLTW